MATHDGSVIWDSQQHTQSTEHASQQEPDVFIYPEDELWGYLQPCNRCQPRIYFLKTTPVYTIGRYINNAVIFPGAMISNNHCTITWHRPEDNSRDVTVTDTSSNGTFINSDRIGRNQTRILKEGNEIAFGLCRPSPDDPLHDYRYIYRHVAGGRPTHGLYASYDVGTELGRGSYGMVMSAMHRVNRRWYAVKTLPGNKFPASINNPDPLVQNSARARAYGREIDLLQRIQHPNICRLEEVFYEENGDINLVLEFIDGGDLFDYTNDNLHGPGLESDVKHIVYQICKAMAYVHSLGITHRDLKPENIMLTRDNPPRVKIVDFGLAKLLDGLTTLHTKCGTQLYAAPEIVTSATYENIVDCWSLGVTVFWMLTKSPPFLADENDDSPTGARAWAERQVQWNILIDAGVSQEAYMFLRGLLKVVPSQRMTFQDALIHPWFTSYTPVYDDDISPPAHSGRHGATLANKSTLSHDRVAPVKEERGIVQDQWRSGAGSLPALPGLLEDMASTNAHDAAHSEALPSPTTDIGNTPNSAEHVMSAGGAPNLTSINVQDSLPVAPSTIRSTERKRAHEEDMEEIDVDAERLRKRSRSNSADDCV